MLQIAQTDASNNGANEATEESVILFCHFISSFYFVILFCHFILSFSVQNMF